MATNAKGSFNITGWNEQPIHMDDGQPKMSAAHVSADYSGDMEGSAKVEYLMMYESESTASFVGMERFTGTLGGKQGSFVFQVVGTFENGVAAGTRTIAKGSGTNELSGISGNGSFHAAMGGEATYEMEYTLL